MAVSWDVGLNTTEVVAIVTGTATLLAGGGATALASYLGGRASRHLARTQAYERLATVAYTPAFRAAEFGDEGSATRARVNAAYEEVTAAVAAVHIRGSEAAGGKADALLGACNDYVTAVVYESQEPSAPPVKAAIQAMLDARDDFLKLAWREEHRRRIPR